MIVSSSKLIDLEGVSIDPVYKKSSDLIKVYNGEICTNKIDGPTDLTPIR